MGYSSQRGSVFVRFNGALAEPDDIECHTITTIMLSISITTDTINDISKRVFTPSDAREWQKETNSIRESGLYNIVGLYLRREEVGCGGNEDVNMDEWSHQAGQN